MAPILYKSITLLITNRVYRHLTDKKILAFEQKGCKRGTRGCKDQLLLDNYILEITKKTKRNASMMWIDYVKAYDSVPHSWIEESLHLYKIDPTAIRFILSLMKKWRTRMVLPHANGSIETDEIRIETGIFQGDAFSPLLFCLAINPISNILNRAKLGFKTLSTSISHLLYMDDLKATTV